MFDNETCCAIYYVYMLIDPRNNQPFYVGKGKENRWKSHFHESKERTSNLFKWNMINKIHEHGMEPYVEFVQKNMTEDDAYELEEKLIRKYGRRRYDDGGILTNLCKDARPPKNTSGTSPQSGMTMEEYYGHDKAAEIKNRISVGVTGDKNGFYGKKHSDENLKKFSENASKQWKGVVRTEQNKENLRKCFTPERREMLRQNRIKMNEQLNTPDFREATGNRNKEMGRNKTKQKITEDLDFYTVVTSELSKGKTPREVNDDNDFDNYNQIWRINKKLEYYIELLGEVRHGR